MNKWTAPASLRWFSIFLLSSLCGLASIGVGIGQVGATTAGAPDAPVNLTASLNAVNGGAVNLSWSYGGGPAVTWYSVYRNGVLLVNGLNPNSTTFTDRTAGSGTTYTYAVSATNSTGEGPQSTPASVTEPGVPSAPQNLMTVPSDGGTVGLAWSPPVSDGGSAITGYRLSRINVQTGATQLSAATLPPSQTSYTDTGLSNGSTYEYVIYASNAVGSSPQSNEVFAQVTFTAPSIPQNFAANADTPGVVLLSWSPPSSNGGEAISGYVVYRGGARLASVAGSTTTYSDTYVASATTYSYTVSAVAYGEGPQSAPVTVTTVGPPTAPQNLAATPGAQGTVQLSWSPPASTGGAPIGYVVFRDGHQVTSGLSAPNYTDTGLYNRTSYSYSVAAANVTGVSPASE